METQIFDTVLWEDVR